MLWTPKSRQLHGGSSPQMQITKSEFDRVFGIGSSTALFEKLDADGDGVLSRSELKATQTSLGSLKPQQVACPSDMAMFPPGEIVVLYRARGVFRAAVADSAAAAGLTSLEPHVNMVSDHMVAEYW